MGSLPRRRFRQLKKFITTHQERSETDPAKRSQDSKQRVPERKGLTPKGAMGLEQLSGGHVSRLERYVITVVKIPAAARQNSPFFRKPAVSGSAAIGCQDAYRNGTSTPVS